MPIGLNGQQYNSEFEALYSSVADAPEDASIEKTVPVDTPKQSDPVEAQGSTEIQGGTPLPTPDLNASAGNVVATRGIVDQLLGTTGERYQTWPEKMVRGAISALALPGDVLSGKVQAGSIQEIERAADLAGLMIAGPAPVASKMADGTLGSFAGVRAKNLDKNALGGAQTLEAAGKSSDEIFEQTGFFRGADNRWRFEIPNKEIKLKDSAFDIAKGVDPSSDKTFSVKHRDILKDDKPHYLDEVIDHPSLFKAYPDLRNIQVTATPKKWGVSMLGAFDSDKNILYLSEAPEELMKSVVIHEMQHAIQKIEGFQRGGNPSMFRPEGLDAAEKTFKKVSKEKESELIEKHSLNSFDIPAFKMAIHNEHLPDTSQSTLKNIKKAKDLGIYDDLKRIVEGEKMLGNAALEHLSKYKSLMGEVEARNAQARFEQDLYSKNPIFTEDVKRQFQKPTPE